MSAMALRSIYGPAHFGNFYELAAPRELGALLREWQRQGINGYTTWFDPYDVPDPFSSDPLYHWPRHRALLLWRRKRECLKAAQDLGLQIGVCFTTNSVYMDQLRPDLAAQPHPKGHMFGPNLCPAHPAARDILRQNMINLMEFLKEGGVRVDYIPAAFYDWGGCDCERCRPWVSTALRLWEEELAPAARAVQPAVKIQFCTWFMQGKENDSFQALLERRPDWLDGVLISPGYKTEWPDLALPRPYRKMLFLHISYASNFSDRYGRTGAIPAPARLQTIFRRCARLGDIAGFQAYSEGIYDDINKFLIGRLSGNPGLDARELVHEYCRIYFRTNPDDTKRLTDAIYRLEQLALNPGDAAALSDELGALGEKCRRAGDWRFDILRMRPQIVELNRQIGGKAQWDAAIAGLDDAGRREFIARVDALAAQRQELLETLERRVYRIGMQISVMHMDLELAAWQAWRSGVAVAEHRKDTGNYIA